MLWVSGGIHQGLQATKAHTTLRFTLSAEQNKDIPVPSGTRGTPDGSLYFATIQML